MKAPKTVVVDKAELVEYIVNNCPSHFYNYVNGHCCLKSVREGICDLHAFAEQLNCPLDCPRLATKEYGCKKGACPRVKATIKELEAKI